MNKRIRLIILIIGLLLIISLFSSAIQDFVNIIIKQNLSHQIKGIITFIITFLLLLIILKMPPFKEIDEQLTRLYRK